MREPVAGDRIDQYELVELLARSGMATIWRAVDTVTGGPCALKVPHLQYESDIVFSERFRREEEVGQTLDHPGVVKVLTPGAKTRPYMAMELVEGRSLRALLKEKDPLPRERAVDFALQLLDALQYLHEHGVVHRDLKPENVIVQAGDRLKILDFGIALFAAERRLTWTGLSNTVGTPDYMAPEQIRGRRGDPRTDVYAVGLMLYEMLTCNLPWDSPNPRALLKAKAAEAPRPPSWFVPGFDPALEAVILKAIARDPRERFGSARQFAEALRDPARFAASAEDGPARARPRGSPRRRRIALAIAACAVLAALLALARSSARHAGAPGAAPPAAGRSR